MTLLIVDSYSDLNVDLEKDTRILGANFSIHMGAESLPIWSQIPIKPLRSSIDKVLFSKQKIVWTDIIEYIISLEPDNIIINYDYTKFGQICASIVYYRLVDKGFDPDRIFRAIMYDADQIAFGLFLDKQTLNDALQDIWHYANFGFLQVKVGIRKAEALKACSLADASKPVKNLNPEGSSSVTYLIKEQLSEYI